MATYIALPPGKLKKKRKRTVISKKDLEKLEALFQQDKWPDRSKKLHLAMVISKSENFISTWFQNRRAKFRRLQQDTETLVKNEDTVKLTFHDVRFSGNDISKSSIMGDKNKENHVKSNQTPRPIGLEEIKLELNVLNKNQNDTFKRAKTVNGNSERAKRSGEMVLQDVTMSRPGIPLSWEFVFRQIVEMAAASEGAMADGHPSITQAVRHAALGVPLRDAKLVYSREYGLDCEAL